MNNLVESLVDLRLVGAAPGGLASCLTLNETPDYVALMEARMDAVLQSLTEGITLETLLEGLGSRMRGKGRQAWKGVRGAVINLTPEETEAVLKTEMPKVRRAVIGTFDKAAQKVKRGSFSGSALRAIGGFLYDVVTLKHVRALWGEVGSFISEIDDAQERTDLENVSLFYAITAIDKNAESIAKEIFRKLVSMKPLDVVKVCILVGITLHWGAMSLFAALAAIVIVRVWRWIFAKISHQISRI